MPTKSETAEVVGDPQSEEKAPDTLNAIDETADDRSDADKAAASHVDKFNARQVAVAAAAAEEAEPDSTIDLPETLKETHALLDEVNRQTVKGAKQASAKQKKIAKLAEHLHKLGQGAPTPRMTAQNSAELSAATTALAFSVQLDQLARQHPSVRQAVDKLREAREKVGALTLENEQLKAELATLKKA